MHLALGHGELAAFKVSDFAAYERQTSRRLEEVLGAGPPDRGLVDVVTERRARCPGLHVYHYNHYEHTSIDHLTELHGTRQEPAGRLTGRFATREDEVDDLFRVGVFTDLYRVVSRRRWRTGRLAAMPDGGRWWPGTTRTTAGPRSRCGTGWRTVGLIGPNDPATSFPFALPEEICV